CDKTTLETILKKIKQLGYEPTPIKSGTEASEKARRKIYAINILRISSVTILILLAMYQIPPIPVVTLVFAWAAAVGGGYPIFKHAYNEIRSRSIGTQTFITISIIAALALAEAFSAAVVALFVLVAEFLELFTVDQSRKAISDLVESAPKTALVRREDEELMLPIEQVTIEDIVIVKPGWMIPVDGAIIQGNASINEAKITGEPIPVEKQIDDPVFAGTICDSGALQIKVTKVGKETTIGKIVQMVEQAQKNKAPVQRFADNFTSIFTPLVLMSALVTLLLTQNILTALTVLIIACPCAVALATPLAVTASLGNASKNGILIKGGSYLESLGKIDSVVLDKTGTITLGKPKVTAIKEYYDHTPDEIITLAATAEKYSEHHLAKAILEYANGLIDKIPDPTSFEDIRGKGVIARTNGTLLLLGNETLIKDHNIPISEEIQQYIHQQQETGQTAILVAHDRRVCGVVSIADVIKPNAKEAIDELKTMGIKKIIMLTGDNKRTAKAISDQLDLSSYHSNLLPKDKVQKIRELTEQQNCKTAMVGDGVNDAPALANATVGIAMGAAGTDITIEAADVALMTDDLSNIPKVVRIGRRTFNTIKQNIIIGILFNIIGILVAGSGLLTPTLAAVAHVIPDILVFINSARLIAR
ncbi:MAG: heavy metal translocating P-type ATPase, partial [Candidatus Hodarchaeales archaeon]